MQLQHQSLEERRTICVQTVINVSAAGLLLMLKAVGYSNFELLFISSECFYYVLLAPVEVIKPAVVSRC